MLAQGSLQGGASVEPLAPDPFLFLLPSPLPGPQGTAGIVLSASCYATFVPKDSLWPSEGHGLWAHFPVRLV